MQASASTCQSGDLRGLVEAAQLDRTHRLVHEIPLRPAHGILTKFTLSKTPRFECYSYMDTMGVAARASIRCLSIRL